MYWVMSCAFKLYQRKENEYVLEVLRKSRVIMKDAKGILKKSSMIRGKQPGAVVFFRTNAPVCSKSIAFLKDHGIDVIEIS